jgi:hypothetical protein
MLEKLETVFVEKGDSKSGLSFAPHLIEYGRIPLHVKLIENVIASPDCLEVKLCVRKRTCYFGPALEIRQWSISCFLRSFAEGDDSPDHQGDYEHRQCNSARKLQNCNRKSLECASIQRRQLQPVRCDQSPKDPHRLIEPAYNKPNYTADAQ